MAGQIKNSQHYSLPVKQVDYSEKQRHYNEGSISPYVRLLVKILARKDAKAINFAKGY
jgi:hypothetical protein